MERWRISLRWNRNATINNFKYFLIFKNTDIIKNLHLSMLAFGVFMTPWQD